MLYKVGDYKDRDTYLRHCLKTVGDMEHIVKEILLSAKMGGSDFQLVRSDLNISQMLQNVCRKNSGLMEDKEMELNMEIQPDFHYEGDGRLIEKVFSNVIGNAAAYSPSYSVITGRHILSGKFRCSYSRGRFETTVYAFLSGGEIP